MSKKKKTCLLGLELRPSRKRQKLRTFQVYVTGLMPQEAVIEVQAYSVEEAMEKAEDEEFEWQECDRIQYFEISSVEEEVEGELIERWS